MSPGDFFEWKQKNTVFQDIAASYDSQLTLTGVGNPQFLFGYAFSANYFTILGVSPELGRTFTAERGPPGRTQGRRFERQALARHIPRRSGNLG